MCFGQNVERTTNSSQTTTPPEWLSSAAAGNVNYAKTIQDAGFSAYPGSQVAPFSGQQQSSFDLGNQVAGGVAPYVGQTGSLLSNYANAGPGSVSASPIYANMSPYMQQYVMQALAPQIEAQNQQFAQQNKGFDAQATGAGAFGDTGWGLGRTNLTNQQNIGRTGLIGNAYNAAFNTAIGAGAQDVSSNLNAQTTNANLRETGLNRELTGATALLNAGTGATNLTNTLGGQQTAQTQAQINAAFNEFMRQQYQDPQFRTALMNSAIGAGKAGAPVTTTGTSTTSAPDNSGFGLLGTALGVAAAPFTGGASLAALGPSLGLMTGGAGNFGGSPATNPNLNPATYGNIAGAADGGPVTGGKPVVVGERGPELLIPGQSGVVIPHEILRAAMEKRNQARLAAAPGLARQLGAAA